MLLTITKVTRRSRVMKFDPRKLNALSVRLYGKRIGLIIRLAGDRQLFAFEQEYIEDQHRPTLSLSFKGSTGGLVTDIRPVGRRVPPFFSNLLPEGHLATILLDARMSIPSANSFSSPPSAPICRAHWLWLRLKKAANHPSLQRIRMTTALTMLAVGNSHCAFRLRAYS